MSEWIPIKMRPMTEDDRKEYERMVGEPPEPDAECFDCEMPDDGQEVLITIQYKTTCGGGVIRSVCMDVCELDEFGYGLEERGDWEDVTAWMPIPAPYRKETRP